MKNIKKQILDINKSDNFLKELREIYIQERDLKVFHQAVVSLHNDSEINLIKEILKISNLSNSFFYVKNMFEAVIPYLDIPIQESMSCVKHTFELFGNDMSAGTVFSSFVKYCEKDENRTKEAIQIINKDVNWHIFITTVIKAGSKFNFDEYLKIAIEFTKHSDVNIRKEAVNSLGALQYENHPVSLSQSFQVIKNIIEKTGNTEVLPTSIETIFKLYTFDNTLEEKTTELIKVALENADDNILYSASIICYYERKRLPIKLFRILLHALENVNYKHKGAIYNIDHGLQYLLAKNPDIAVSYLEKALIKNKELSITSFDFVLSDLHEKHNELLNKCITKWLIDGNISLCKAVMDIVGFIPDSKMILSADISQLKMQDNKTHLFVIKKAIGWLFNYQISAVSFIISMIEILDQDNINMAENLLFDPFLISYSGSIENYLKSIKKPKIKTKKVVSNLLQRFEKYHNDSNSAWNVKELKSSQEQRESYSRLHNKQMFDAMEKSKKDNMLSSLISEVTVLYGRRSVSYHSELGNNPKDIRQEATFQKFEHSVEIPSLEFIDPHGLNYMLFIFKTEKK